jgi:cell division protein FtsB
MSQARIRIWLKSPFLVGGLALLTLLLLRQEWQQWQKRSAVDREIQTLQNQQAQLEDKNNTLEQSLSYLQTVNYKERLARQQLNMQKQGEIIISFPENIEGEVSPQAGTVAGGPSNAAKWWDHFFPN